MDIEGFLKDIEEFEKPKERKHTMSFLQIGEELNKYQDEHTVPAGEYLLRITGAVLPDGQNYMIVRFEIVGDPYAKEIVRLFNLPGAGRNPREENNNIGTLRKFYTAFGMEYGGGYTIDLPEPDGFLGREAYCILGPPADDGKGYGEQNKISKFTSRA